MHLGIDLGTSGARAAIVDDLGQLKAEGSARLESAAMRDPVEWWRAVQAAIVQALTHVSAGDICSVAVSATSGTVLAVDEGDRPTGQVFMYSDPCADAGILRDIRQHAPNWTPARAGTGGLGGALALVRSGVPRVAHQADWINFNLCGRWCGDSSSALKSGYDAVIGDWPVWVSELGLVMDKRSEISACGTKIGHLSPQICKKFGLRDDVTLVAGTTDGCASFLATGADQIGDAVSVLGTTLTVKLLSDRPVFDARAGVYSHRIEGKWLVGGASNSGGGVLLAHFPEQVLEALSERINGALPSGLTYYPLSKPGERFPFADPEKAPRLEPRPKDDALFLHGMLDGLGAIEAAAYSKLAEMGAPRAARIFATGGGTKNPAWMQVRARLLPAELAQPKSIEAAFGTALLAKRALA